MVWIDMQTVRAQPEGVIELLLSRPPEILQVTCKLNILGLCNFIKVTIAFT